MTYCFQCGLKGTPESATGIDEDGEPACTLHRAKTIQTEKKVVMSEEFVRKCAFEGCGKELIRTNQSGFCTKHLFLKRLTANLTRAPAARRTPAPYTKIVGLRVPGTGDAAVTVHLTSAQLDRFLLSLPMEAKHRMLTTFLAEA